jgi:hypothetical protein
MSNRPYTDRQIEVANLLRSVGGDGVSGEVIAEIIEMVENEKKVAPASPDDALQTDALIRLAIINETDWRKKAQLNALLISRSLE